jgi:hypothetical protein
VESQDIDCVCSPEPPVCEHGRQQGKCANSDCAASEREDGGLSANDLMDLKMDLCNPEKAEECLKRMPRLLDDLERARTMATYAAEGERLAIVAFLGNYANGCRWADEINLCYDLMRRINGRKRKT